MRTPRPLPESVIELASRRAGLANFAELKATGVSPDRIRRLTASGALHRLHRGVYLISEARAICRNEVGDYQARRLHHGYLGVLAAGPAAAATGLSALAVLGIQGLPQQFRAEFALKCGGPAKVGAEIRNRREPYSRSTEVNGVRVVEPVIAAAQAIREAPRKNAIAVLDNLLSQKIISPDDLAEARGLVANRVGAQKARDYLALADARSESPAETYARIGCLDAGWPPDAVQLLITNAYGVRIARVDLGWRLPDGRWLLGEVDGYDFHSTRDQLAADRNRQNHLVTPQTILRRWSGSEAGNGKLLADVRLILEAAGWLPGQISGEAARTLALGTAG